MDVVLQDQKTCRKTKFDSVELPFACGMQGKYHDETCPIFSRGPGRHCAQSLARRSCREANVGRVRGGCVYVVLETKNWG